MRPGHKVPDCDGKWVDISTFERRRILCTKCRATIDNITLDQYDDLPDARGPGEIEIIEKEEDEPMMDFLPLSLIFIVAVALSGFLGFILGRLQ